MTTQNFEEDYSTPEYKLYEDDDGDGVPHTREYEDELTPITYDTYIGAEVVLPKGNDMVCGTVKSSVKDIEGQPIGKADKNPILDTRVYNVEFSDGEVAELGETSLQNACMLSVILKEISTGSWITLWITGRMARQFSKITNRLH